LDQELKLELLLGATWDEDWTAGLTAKEFQELEAGAEFQELEAGAEFQELEAGAE